MIQTVLSILFFFSFSYSSDFSSLFTVENLKKIEKEEKCIYPNDNTKKYQFCNVKLIKCGNSPGIGFFKYKSKIDNIIYLYQPKVPSSEDFLYIYSLVQCESGQDPFKISIDGGYGLFQITTGKKESLEVESNSKKGISLLRNIYLYVTSGKFVNYNPKIKDDKLLQFYILRIYNGGSKQLINFHYNYKGDKYYETMFCYTKASKYSKRYPCFEKVNLYYPFKIMLLTSPIFKKYTQ